MRKILILTMFFGFALVLGTAFMAIDGYMTEDRKARVSESVEDYARSQAEREGIGRRNRGNGFWVAFLAMKDGILKSAPVLVKEELPAAPEGWTHRPYATSDAVTLLGVEPSQSRIVSTTQQRIFTDFKRAGEMRRLGAAQTYTNGQHVMLLRVIGDMKEFRRGDKAVRGDGDIRRAAPARNVFATLDGIAVGQAAQFYTDLLKSAQYPVAYRRFEVMLDEFFEIEVVTNASDADVLALLGNIDMDMFQAALPYTTKGYAADTGVVFSQDGPPDRTPPGPTLAMRALKEFRTGYDPKSPEGRVLRAIAEGKLDTWDSVNHFARIKLEPTPALIDLLGPHPDTQEQAKL